jgi:ribose-phosphate pyrophosphokinase
VHHRDAIIFDDEIATAGTLIASVNTLLEAGVRQIHVGATHPVLCGPAISRLATSAITSVTVTNTVAVTEEKRIKKITVLSVASLIAKAIHCIHTGESVGALFK